MCGKGGMIMLCPSFWDWVQNHSRSRLTMPRIVQKPFQIVTIPSKIENTFDSTPQQDNQIKTSNAKALENVIRRLLQYRVWNNATHPAKPPNIEPRHNWEWLGHFDISVGRS